MGEFGLCVKMINQSSSTTLRSEDGYNVLQMKTGISTGICQIY